MPFLKGLIRTAVRVIAQNPAVRDRAKEVYEDEIKPRAEDLYKQQIKPRAKDAWEQAKPQIEEAWQKAKPEVEAAGRKAMEGASRLADKVKDEFRDGRNEETPPKE